MTLALEIIGHIDVPASVQEHRFYKEVLGVTKVFTKKIAAKLSREPVIGTANSRRVELYGWAKNVAKHTDDSGFIYFVALNDADSIIVSKDDDKELIIDLPKGAVARMNDYKPHFTFDDKARVCAFLGSYKEPCDRLAIAKLTKGVNALAVGKYYGAPRVRHGFRAMLPDECYVMAKNFDQVEMMLLKDAKKADRFIQTCGLCKRLAVKIDSHFPYFLENNRCRNHLKADA